MSKDYDGEDLSYDPNRYSLQRVAVKVNEHEKTLESMAEFCVSMTGAMVKLQRMIGALALLIMFNFAVAVFGIVLALVF